MKKLHSASHKKKIANSVTLKLRTLFNKRSKSESNKAG